MDRDISKRKRIRVGIITGLIFWIAIAGICIMSLRFEPLIQYPTAIEVTHPSVNTRTFKVSPTATTVTPTAYFIASSSTPTHTPQPSLTNTLRVETASVIDIGDLVVHEITLANGSKLNFTTATTTVLGQGAISLNCPLDMVPGKMYQVILRITPVVEYPPTTEIKQTLHVVQRAGDYLIPDPISIFNIKTEVYPVMQAEIKGENFKIEPHQRNRLAITWPKEIVWVWGVSPKKVGHNQLNLLLSIPIILSDGTEANSILKSIVIPIEVLEPTATRTRIPTRTPKPTRTLTPTRTITTTPTQTRTSTPTITVTPTKASLIGKIIEDPGSSATLLVGILAAIIAIIGTIIAYKGTIRAAEISKENNPRPKEGSTSKPQTVTRQSSKKK